MAKIMDDTQRLAVLEAYNPQEHLISVGTNKDRSPVLYYPAAWRLYELRLRYPHFVLEADIFHMDEEHGTVIVKAIGYNGLDYASSALKGTALKQGKLSELDKVETKAKSRVARDVGIGTEYALDLDADETDAHQNTFSQPARAPKPAPPRLALTAMPRESAPAVQPLPNNDPTEQQLSSIVKLAELLGKSIDTLNLPATYGEAREMLASLTQEYRALRTASATPVHTVSSVKAFFAKVFSVKPEHLDAKWAAYVVQIIGFPTPDSGLADAELLKLYTYAAKREEELAGKKAG